MKGGTSQFYPIYIDASGKIERIGEHLSHGLAKESAPEIKGCTAVFPIRDDGTEMNWGVIPSSLRVLHSDGFVRVGRHTPNKPQKYEVSYLLSGRINDIKTGKASVVGRNPDGSVIAKYITHKMKMPVSTWLRLSHNAEQFGTELVKDLLGEKKFPYPKSLYAVEDALSLFIGDKRNAVILDFFAGSGTTAHAVMRLNRQDGGQRQCISVTNNEVAADEQRALREANLRPGDPEWEQWGICDYITKPRVEAAITGQTPDGIPIEGEYQFGNLIEKEVARKFKHIGFADPTTFDLKAKKQLVALIDVLPQNLVTGDSPFIVSSDQKHTTSVLFDPESDEDWLAALEGQEHITEFYIVTPVKKRFDELKAQVSDLLGPIIKSVEDPRPMAEGFAENAEFFTLTYETPVAISHNRAFARIAPLLWLRAGSAGRRIDCLPEAGWAVVERYGLLTDLDQVDPFREAIEDQGTVRIAYVVTDDERRFQAVVRRLPAELEPVRLYESYLTNFRFSMGR
jgi:adenine-specific DNA-methyltransferase